MILRHIDVIRLLSNIYRQSNAIRGYYTATQKIVSHFCEIFVCDLS